MNQGTNSLAEQGINVAAEATARGISQEQLAFWIEGTGPCCSLQMTPVNGQARWQVQIREGELWTWKQWRWSQPSNQVYTFPWDIETNTWYDFVVRMRSSQGPTGRFAIWIRKVVGGVVQNPMQISAPDWEYVGPTEYITEVVQGIRIRAYHEIRKGLYRWYRHPPAGSNAVPIAVGSTDPNRYARFFEGPRRYWIGDSDAGLGLVNPAQAPA